MNQGCDNVRKVLRLADSIDWNEGLKAYTNYRRTMKDLSSFYGFRLREVAAVFAATSPNNDYIKNLRSTVSILYAVKNDIPVEDVTVSTYRACARRAYLYAQGKPFLKHTEGDKTRAFYQNILFPKKFDPVTVDGHMVSAWNYHRMTMKKAVRFSFNYGEIAEGVRCVARSEGLIPNQVQAISWFTWKRIHDVQAVKQLHLARHGNQWRTYIAPDEIRRFPLMSEKRLFSQDERNEKHDDEHAIDEIPFLFAI